MKPREERQRVMLPARMRSPSGWSDACILNISSRGLLVYSNGSAQPGSFVEIRRGSQLVVARVVWRNSQRIGLSSSDPVHIQDIVSSETAASAVRSGPLRLPVERRRIPRDPDRSRARGRAIEFMSVVLIGAALASAAVAAVGQALGSPLSAVAKTLSAH